MLRISIQNSITLDKEYAGFCYSIEYTLIINMSLWEN